MDNTKNHPDWEQLPLPNAEESWQKMKGMLDKDDKDRVPPPVFFTTCAGWGLLGLAVLVMLWFIMRPDLNWTDRKIANLKKPPAVAPQKEQPVEESTTTFKNTINNQENSTTYNKRNERENKSAAPFNKRLETTNEKKGTKENKTDSKENRINSFPLAVSTRNTGKAAGQNKKPLKRLTNSTTAARLQGNQTGAVAQKNASALEAGTPAGSALSAAVDHQEIDTIQQQEPKQDTSTATPGSSTEENKKASQKKSSFHLTAGIGLQQQIPVGGQDAFPYNYYGRKGSLSDYIPSAYIRLHKNNKWFIQAELRYGAPQSVKDFAYSRQTAYDTTTQSLRTTTLYLKKTYYHQVPVSFNWFIKPHWSIGAGGIYSRFYGAVTEEEVKSINVFTQAEKTTKKIVQVPEYNDSFLYKTQLHLLLQTEYGWKRFSFGLRYKKDIQPYIRYTQPDGRVNAKKNQSLEAILRFRLWRSSPF